jgi:hypothetical protein
MLLMSVQILSHPIYTALSVESIDDIVYEVEGVLLTITLRVSS